MPIAAGSRVGPYEVLGLIGTGGMGEVYRARDTRLGRHVAIKTLPADLAGHSDRLRRFEIEARAASQLSHPNILSIFDIGESNGQPYIVSELLEGESLRDRLKRGSLPPKRAIEIGAAIADALAAAHAGGIVHRDLKPENLFLLRDGRPKILDFGIAKLTTAEPGAAGEAGTMTALTDAGVAVGTLGYMAPEQLRGHPVDHRVDLFGFGAILYEMLAGTPAFARDSRIGTTNAILESDPVELGDSVAPALRRIIQRCLEKDRDRRFQSARDLAFALELSTGAIPEIATGGPAAVFDWRLAAAGVALAAVVGTGVWVIRAPSPTAPPPVRRFEIAAPPGTTLLGHAVSPDGRHLVMATHVTPLPDTRRLYLRSLDHLEPRELPGTEGGSRPFFSPDGTWVGFEAGGQLKKVALAGGSPVALGKVQDLLEATWAPTGEIIVAQGRQGLAFLSAEGGALRPLTTLDQNAGEIEHRTPTVLADGSAVLFTINAGAPVFRIASRSLTTGEQRTIVSSGSSPRVLACSHIVFRRGNSLYAARFDASRREVLGER